MIDLQPYINLTTMMVLATKDKQWRPYTSNLYFGYNPKNYICYFISNLRREHSQHILNDKIIAWSIINTEQYWFENKDKKGLQFQWDARLLEWKEAQEKFESFYEKRIHPPAWLPENHHIFECIPKRVKIWDENLYGWAWKIINF